MSYDDDDTQGQFPRQRRRFFDPEDDEDPAADSFRPWPHSGLGITSFILGVVAILFVVLMVVLIGATASRRFRGGQDNIDMMAGLLVCGTGVSTLVGVGLGIGAVCQARRRKVFGVVGLCLNGIILLGILVVVFLGMAMEMS